MFKLTDIVKEVTGLGVYERVLVGIGAAAFVGVVALGGYTVLNAPRKAAVARAQAHVAQVQVQTTTQAAKAVIGLQQKADQKSAQVQQRQTENSHAIDRLPSSAGSIPDSDADAWRRGLCLYDDTDCSGGH